MATSITFATNGIAAIASRCRTNPTACTHFRLGANPTLDDGGSDTWYNCQPDSQSPPPPTTDSKTRQSPKKGEKGTSRIKAEKGETASPPNQFKMKNSPEARLTLNRPLMF